MKGKIVIALALAGLLGAGGIMTTSAASRFTVHLGYGGYVAPGRWMPLAVEFDGKLDAPRVEVVHQFKKSPAVIECFPFQNSNRVEASVYIIPEADTIKVRLFSGGEMIAAENIELHEQLFPGHMVLTVDVPSLVQQKIEATRQPEETIRVIPVPADNLPSFALNYDNISGIVVTDPGPVLTPAQTQALRDWLGGGGRLVVRAARPVSESIVAGLGLPYSLQAPVNEYPIGIGRIALLSVDSPDGEIGSASFWRQRLVPEPYNRMIHGFGGEFFPYSYETALQGKPAEKEIWKRLPLVLFGWLFMACAIGYFVKRNTAAYLLIFTVFCIGLAIPAGAWLSLNWQRGSMVQTRVIRIPGTADVLVDNRIHLNQNHIWDPFTTQSSPWGVSFAWNHSETGRIGFATHDPIHWSHSLAIPRMVVRKSGSGWLQLTGRQPLSAALRQRLSPPETMRLAAANPPQWLPQNRRMALWDRGVLWVWQRHRLCHGTDLDPEELPGWLRNQPDWLQRLRQSAPRMAWLIGAEPMPELGLEIEGGTVAADVCWAMPLGEAEK